MATMERPRPSSEEEEAPAVSSTSAPESAAAEAKPEAQPLPANPEEAVEALEKRLEGLGGSTVPAAQEAVKEEAKKPAAPAPAAAPAAAAKSAPAGKNALLARIMAAQEKAKAAEAASKVAEAEFSKTKEQVKEEAAAAERQKSAEEAQAEIMAKLSGGMAKAAAAKKAEGDAPPSFAVAEAGMKPPPFETAAANMKPPSFEAAAGAMPPPAFHAVKSTLKAPAPPLSAPLAPPAPSAPTFDPLAEPPPAAPTKDTVDLDFIAQQGGVEKVMPPPSASEQAPAAPPSFEQFEARATGAASAPDIDESLFDLDELGNALGPEEKQKMIAEQRSIMAAIEREAAANKAAIAAAQAENFEQRSGAAAVRAVNDGPAARSSGGASAASAACAATSAASASSSSDVGQTVNIGEGQNVALHGQEKTKKAIADGTAILVQCLNCNNWMQVTESATLMFCPVCQVVSPVMKQDEVQTSEEARQLDMDHKLAMQLQAEINSEVQAEEQDRRQFQQKQEEEEGYVSSFLRMLKGEEAPSTNTERLVSGSGTTARAHAHAYGGQEKSWFDTFSEYVSVGVTDGAAAPRVGEISVSRPPGMTSATTGAEIGRARGNEQRGLLASVNGGMSPQHSAMAGMGSARVAESKPLFSCVMDSVTSAAAAAADTVTHYATGEEEGSRREGLLSVTGAGREPGGGSYHKI
mmetsp:Transcript_27343/g.64035  ORF Transcript_27343/g.64035 Transcript_27343/m.64035 type:complete len:692 (+) Transcript_27343:313-2388(+)